MPFVTEEIWQKIPEKTSGWIMTAEWPNAGPVSKESVEKMEKLIGVITSIRNARAFWNIPVKEEIKALFGIKEKGDKDILEKNKLLINKLARCSIEKIDKNLDRPRQSVAALVKTISVFIPIGETIDVEKEKKRVEEKVEKFKGILSGIDKKLNNKGFLDRAPEDVVRQEKEKKTRFELEIRNLKENLDALR
jgi:valyl-tRNA synthetase